MQCPATMSSRSARSFWRIKKNWRLFEHGGTDATLFEARILLDDGNVPAMNLRSCA